MGPTHERRLVAPVNRHREGSEVRQEHESIAPHHGRAASDDVSIVENDECRLFGSRGTFFVVVAGNNEKTRATMVGDKHEDGDGWRKAVTKDGNARRVDFKLSLGEGGDDCCRWRSARAILA